jgi:hypothetical protein
MAKVHDGKNAGKPIKIYDLKRYRWIQNRPIGLIFEGAMLTMTVGSCVLSLVTWTKSNEPEVSLRNLGCVTQVVTKLYCEYRPIQQSLRS